MQASKPQDSSPSTGSDPASGGPQDDDEPAYLRPFMEGLFQGGLTLGLASACADSLGISWDLSLPTGVPEEVVAIGMVPLLFPLLVCWPSWAMGPELVSQRCSLATERMHVGVPLTCQR